MKHLNFGVGEASKADESFVVCDSERENYDWLVIFDSRGASVQENVDKSVSYLSLLIKWFIDHNFTYLILSRPKYLTVFPTILSFINNNKINIKYLITNVGFVDATPKKKSIVDDILLQARDNGVFPQVFDLSTYMLSSGKEEQLKSINYTDSDIKNIAEKIESCFKQTFLINTPLIDPNKNKFSRERPSCFYQQLYTTNKIIDSLTKCSSLECIDISRLELKTYDGVHYTSNDHKKIFDSLINTVLG